MNNPDTDCWGNRRWYNDEGKLHREDGPAVEYAYGAKHWYINGKRHREGGPSIEDSYKSWWINGKCHRENGPAIEWWNGDKWYYYNDELIGKSDEGFTKKDFERYLKIKEYW